MITVMELQLIFFLLSFLHGIYGQVTGPPSTTVASGEDVSLVCTSTETAPAFTWTYVTAGQPLYVGTTRATTVERYANIVLQEGVTDAQMSILDISDIQLEDEGEYLCSTITTTGTTNTVVTVEVESTRSLSVVSTIESNIDMYEATCEALGGKPDETIAWMLGDDSLSCGVPGETPPTPAEGLSSTTSVCTFQATSENYNQTLKCVITGHTVSGLDGEVTDTLDTHTSPLAFGTTVSVDYVTQGTGIKVSCTAENQPRPAMRNYYIFSNDTLIHESLEVDNEVTVSDPEAGTQYTCIAGNYLGNTTLSDAKTYDPSRTTTPPPTTALETTSKGGNETGSGGTAVNGLTAGAYAGIAIGVIACIVIIVLIVLYLLKPERFCFEAGGPKSSGSSKPAGSAVGSSNGSEREKTKPEAAPRGHGSIQHTNDNPNQDMYAMVDKKPSGGRGGDAPDRGSGPGQNEPQGMLYADLDLSHKAGHTDKHVPKNENDVVVYSSILV